MRKRIQNTWIYKVKRRLFFLPRKSWLSAPKAILGFFPRSLESCSFWRLLRLAASLAFLRRFSSSEPDASSSDSYSATTCQPSLLLSAIFVSFCRFRIRCLPLGKFLDLRQIWLDAFTFNFNAYKMASNSALGSNCFWFPLNRSCTTSLSSLLLCSICFSFIF